MILLCQYVFGVAFVELQDVAFYSSDRIAPASISKETYTSVENLLQNKGGRKDAVDAPTGNSFVGYEIEDILIGNIRPYLKKIWKADRNGGTNGDVLVIRCRDKDVILPEYLYHVLASESFFTYSNNHAKGAKMPRGDKQATMHYELYLPPIDEQKRVAEILDRFDALCNDITEGIPAEIEARTKQYEYYRDKMLTFPVGQRQECKSQSIL